MRGASGLSDRKKLRWGSAEIGNDPLRDREVRIGWRVGEIYADRAREIWKNDPSRNHELHGPRVPAWLLNDNSLAYSVETRFVILAMIREGFSFSRVMGLCGVGHESVAKVICDAVAYEALPELFLTHEDLRVYAKTHVSRAREKLAKRRERKEIMEEKSALSLRTAPVKRRRSTGRRSAISEDTVKEIVERVRGGQKAALVAKEFGIGYSTVTQLVREAGKASTSSSSGEAVPEKGGRREGRGGRRSSVPLDVVRKIVNRVRVGIKPAIVAKEFGVGYSTVTQLVRETGKTAETALSPTTAIENGGPSDANVRDGEYQLAFMNTPSQVTAATVKSADDGYDPFSGIFETPTDFETEEDQTVDSPFDNENGAKPLPANESTIPLEGVQFRFENSLGFQIEMTLKSGFDGEMVLKEFEKSILPTVLKGRVKLRISGQGAFRVFRDIVLAIGQADIDGFDLATDA